MLNNSPLAITQLFIRSHIEERNLEGALSCLADMIVWFGIGDFELIHGKKEACRYLTEEIDAFPNGYKIDFLDMTETMLTEDSGTVFGHILITDPRKKSRLDCRLTSVCMKCDDHFLITTLHTSLPINLQHELKEQQQQELSNAEIQMIIGNIPGGVHRCPLFDRIHVDYVSPGFEEMSGYTRSEIHTLFQDNYTKLLVEEDRTVFSNAICQLANKADNRDLEYRMCRKDGTIIRVVDHFRSIRMKDGRMWGFGVATNVTEQHEALAQLKLLTDSIPGGLAVFEYSSGGLNTVYFSDGVCDLVDYTREEYAQISKNHFVGLIFEEDFDVIKEKITQVVAGNPAIDCVYRVRTKHGNCRWINLRGIVTERRGGIICANAVLLDITDSKIAEEKLRIRDEEYSLAIGQSGKTIYRYTIADQSVYLLQKADDVFDFLPYVKNVPESLIQKGFIAPESIRDFTAFYEAIDRGEKTGCVILRRKRNDGSLGWCRAHFTTLFSSTGEPVSAVISIGDITKQHEQELENAVLRQNEELFQIVVSHSDRFIIKYDIKTRIAYIQPCTARAFDVDEVVENVPYCSIEQGGIADESVTAYIDFHEKLIGGEPIAKVIVKMRRSGQLNQWGWYRFDGSLIFDDKKQPTYAVISFVEITKQYEKELAYERLCQHVNQLSEDAVLYFEADLTEMKIKRSGGHWLGNIRKTSNIESAELLEVNIQEMVYPEDREAVRYFFNRKNLLRDFSGGKTEKEGEYRIFYNHLPRWVSVTIEIIKDPYTENILVYVLFKDIDEIKKKEMNILKQAETDGLTNLYNRITVEGKIGKILEARQTSENKQDERFAVAILDVDNLKEVNDTLGHIQGDRAIRGFADILRDYFSEQDVVGRIGGDEFIAFLRNIEDEKNVEDMIRALVHKLSTLCVGENNEYHLHASIGVTISSADQENFETLYKKADTALYYVKRHGKNNYALYHTGMETM
ncbi:MAG: diguanylate cyclase [Clostridium sp.]